jgi:hypothetical protein
MIGKLLTQQRCIVIHFVLDVNLTSSTGDYAAFVVPQGLFNECIFSTKKGRTKRTESARYLILAIVTMHRNRNYENLDENEAELNETIKSFAPFFSRLDPMKNVN